MYFCMQITQRASQVRGELKTKARPLTKSHYKLKTTNGIKAAIRANRELYEDLTNKSSYIYEVQYSCLYYISFLSLTCRYRIPKPVLEYTRVQSSKRSSTSLGLQTSQMRALNMARTSSTVYLLLLLLFF